MSEAAATYRAASQPAGERDLRVVADTTAVYATAAPSWPSEAGPVDPGEAVAALGRALDLLGRAELRGLSDRGLLEHTVAVDRTLTRLEAQRGRALRAVDGRKAYRHDGCVTTGGWLGLRTRRDPKEAARAARTAVRVRVFDRLRDAWDAGDVTSGHVEAVTRRAVGGRRRLALLDHEDTLVHLARRARPAEVAVACKKIADVVDRDGVDTPPGDCRSRGEVDFARTFEGRGHLRGDLDPVLAERFDNLLDALSEPDPPDTPTHQRRTPAQRRHDAFDRLVRAAEEHPDLPSSHGAKPHVAMTIDLLTLLANPELASRATRLGSGAELPLERALHLLSDAKLTAILMLGPYRAVGLGRTHRVLPTWLRPVLRLVHRHCRGPGCDRPFSWSQAAHTATGYADGGDTDLDHSAPLCPGHHRLLDHAGWRLHHDPDTATCTWTSPDGRTVITTHPPDP